MSTSIFLSPEQETKLKNIRSVSIQPGPVFALHLR